MTVKYLSVADIHLNGGGETDEGLALLKVAQIAIYEGVQIVGVHGDVYHSKSTPAQRWIFKEFLRQLTAHGIQVVILRGNHDEEGDLKIFHDPDRGVHVFERPGDVILIAGGEQLQVHAIPHYNAAAVALEEDSLADLGETGTGLYDQMLNGIFNEVRTWEGPSLVAFHGTVTDAHLDNGHIPKHDGIVLNGPLLASLGCPVRGGHYHAGQEVHPNVRYSGSITLRNYGESGDKGVLIDTVQDGQWVGCEFHSTEPSARITIDAEWMPEMETEITNGFRIYSVPEEDALKGARVRFRYKVKQSQVATVNLDDIKAFFERVGVREIKFERDLIIETAIRSESIMQAVTVIDMHESWLELKGLGQHKPAQRALYNSIVKGIEAPAPKPALEVIEGESTRETAIA